MSNTKKDRLVRIGSLHMSAFELEDLIEALKERLLLADFTEGPEERDNLIHQVQTLQRIH